MNRVMATYVRIVDAVNYRIGRIMMYGIFVMMAILLWSSVSKTFFLPSLWTLEMAQFAMVAYYIMGRTLFDPARIQCAHGSVLRRLERFAAKPGSILSPCFS